MQHAPLVSADEYLAGEAASAARHEYLGGVIYGMAGATERHNELAGNIFAALHAQLRGKQCRPFIADMLIRVEVGGDLRFYYPDVSIICRPAGPMERVQTNPSFIFEVLSDSTARIDTGEKRTAYLTIPTLESYVLVDSDRREVTVWRQHDGRWSPEVFTAPDATLKFASAGCSLTVGEIYEGTGL